MARLELFFPTKPYVIGQHFGMCNPDICATYKAMGLKGHNGIDSQAATGTKVYAAHDGIVTFAGEDDSAGYGVVIRTLDKRAYNDSAAFFKTIYWHLLPSGIQVKAGQKVKVGDFIALSDNTGISKGPHLHFGLKPVAQGEDAWRWDNIEQANGFLGAIDPEPYFNGIHAVDARTALQKYNTLITLLQKLLGKLISA